MGKYLFLIMVFLGINALNAQEKREFQLNFESNSYKISKENADFMDKEIVKIRSAFYRNCKIVITGYTDNTGSLAHNKTLSRQRAKAITDYFVSKGFSAKRVTFKGQDIKNPIGDNNSEEGKAKNRRVNVLVTFNFNDINQLRKFDNKPQTFKINTSKDSVFTVKSGTKITIPANGFVDENGNDVQGDIQFVYSEQRTPIDFILSGIPMDIEENGKKFFFNSTGMFEMKAYKDGKPVSLKAGKSITVDFKRTADLPNTNFYQLDTISNKWNKLRGITNNWGWGCWVGKEEEPKCPLQGCQALDFVKKSGTDFAQSKVSLFDLAHITNPGNFDRIQQRLKDDKVKIASNKNRLKTFGPRLNKATTLFEIKRGQNDRIYTDITVESSDADATSKKIFEKISWKCESNTIKEELFQKKWPVFLIEKTESENYTLTFKDSLSEYRIDRAQIAFNKKTGKRKAGKITAKMMEATNGVSNEMNATITTYKNLKEGIENMTKANEAMSIMRLGTLSDDQNKEIIRMVECFYVYNIELMPYDERAKTQDEWFKYFDSHKEEILKRYTVDIFENEHYKRCIEEAERARKQQENDQRAQDIVQVNIGSLGVFNFDIIQQLENPTIINAQYKTVDGKSIEPYFIYLLDSKVNGIIRYGIDEKDLNTHKFAFAPESKNFLIAFDEEGEAFMLSAEKFKKLTSGKNKTVTFVLEKVTSREQIEEELK